MVLFKTNFEHYEENVVQKDKNKFIRNLNNKFKI